MKSLALVLVLLLGAAAAAQPPEAQNLLDAAIDAFNAGSFDQSLQLLERARRATHDPKLLGRVALYLGLSHGAEGRKARARQAFAEALAHDPTLRLDTYRIKPELCALFDAVRREKLAVLRVMASASSAEAWLDGKRVGPLPFEASLPAGAVELELRSPGGASLYRRRVELVAGRVTLVEVMLAPGAGTTAAATRPVAPVPPRERPRRIWTWVALGGALAASAVAIGLGVSARSDHDAACALLVDTGASCDSRTALQRPADLAHYRDLYDAVGAKSLGANISWGLAGGLAVTAVVLFFVEGRRPAAERAPRVGVGPGPSRSLGLSLSAVSW